MPLHCQKFQNSKTIEFCGNPVNWIPVYKREQGAMYNRSIVTKDKRETEECAHGVFSEVKNTVTGKTRKDRRRRSGYAGRQSVMPGIVFDVTLPKWLVSTLSWLSVHVRLPTYSNSARYMSSQHLLRRRRWINKLLKDNRKNWSIEILLCVSSNSILYFFRSQNNLAISRINATITRRVSYAKSIENDIIKSNKMF